MGWDTRVAVVLVLAVACGGSLADGIFVSADSVPTSARASAAAQKAVVIREGKDEVLLLQTTYEGPKAGFAWVVPVPSVPSEIFEAEPLFLQYLFAQTSPLVQTIVPEAHQWFPAGGKKGVPGLSEGPAGGVRPTVAVHARMEVGDYDASVLSATGADALLDWLLANGYRVAPEAGGALDGYVRTGSAFVAVRFREEAANGEATAADVAPLGIRFATERLWFPLAVSKGSAPELTSLLLCIVTDQPVECETYPCVWLGTEPRELGYGATYGDLRREATRGAGGGPALLCEYAGSRAIAYADLSYRKTRRGDRTHTTTGLAGRTVTRYFGLVPREAMADLTFAPALHRPSEYRVLVVREWLGLPLLYEHPGAAAGVATGLVALLALVVLRRLRRRRAAVPLSLLLAAVLVGSAAAIAGQGPKMVDGRTARSLGRLREAVDAYRARNGCYPHWLSDLRAGSAPEAGLDASGNRVARAGEWEAREYPDLWGDLRSPGLIYDVLNLHTVDSAAYSVRVSGLTGESADPESAYRKQGGPPRRFWRDPDEQLAKLREWSQWTRAREASPLLTGRVRVAGNGPNATRPLALAPATGTTTYLGPLGSDVCPATGELLAPVALADWASGLPWAGLFVAGAGTPPVGMDRGPADVGSVRVSASGERSATRPWVPPSSLARVQVRGRDGALLGEVPECGAEFAFSADERQLYTTARDDETNTYDLVGADWLDGEREVLIEDVRPWPLCVTQAGPAVVRVDNLLWLAEESGPRYLPYGRVLTIGESIVAARSFGSDVLVVIYERLAGCYILRVPLAEGAAATEVGAFAWASTVGVAILDYREGAATVGLVDPEDPSRRRVARVGPGTPQAE